MPRVRQVVEQSQGFDGLDAEVIAERTRQLALRAAELANTPIAAVTDRADRPCAVPGPRTDFGSLQPIPLSRR